MNNDNSVQESTTVNNSQEENSVKDTITLNTEQLAKVVHLMETYQWTYEETIKRIIDRGLYDVTYRTKRNREEYQAFKAFKKMNS